MRTINTIMIFVLTGCGSTTFDKYELFEYLYGECTTMCLQFEGCAEFYAANCPEYEGMVCDVDDARDCAEALWDRGIAPGNCVGRFHVDPNEFPDVLVIEPDRDNNLFDETFKEYALLHLAKYGKCPFIPHLDVFCASGVQ